MDLFDGVEIWREQPDAPVDATVEAGISIAGQGNARSVLCWRGLGSAWLGRSAAGISQVEDTHRLVQSALQGTGTRASPRELEAHFDTDAFSAHTGLPLSSWCAYFAATQAVKEPFSYNHKTTCKNPPDKPKD